MNRPKTLQSTTAASLPNNAQSSPAGGYRDYTPDKSWRQQVATGSSRCTTSVPRRVRVTSVSYPPRSRPYPRRTALSGKLRCVVLGPVPRVRTPELFIRSRCARGAIREPPPSRSKPPLPLLPRCSGLQPEPGNTPSQSRTPVRATPPDCPRRSSSTVGRETFP